MAKKEIKAYENVPFLPLGLETETSRHGAQTFSNVKSLQVGYGSEVFRVDRDGMWAGAERFSGAPWSVDWQGNMTATSVTISGYIPTGGALGDIGTGNITGTYIADGAIVTDKLAANTITAAKIAAGTLTSASGVFGDISAEDITTGTLTGIQIQTASSGQRMVLFSSLATFYNSSGDDVVSLYASSNTYLVFGEQTTTNIVLAAGSSGVVGFRIGGTTIAYVDNNSLYPASDSSYDLGETGTRWATLYVDDITVTGDITVGDDILGANRIKADIIDLDGGGYVDECRAIYFENQSSSPSIEGEMRYRESGGNKNFRVYLASTIWNVDLTSA